ncbi:Hypothetical_protein [Hexamita inflata]|uniref:Hypothetical_protein n=1 Tax=Hexamita inflata TaxID=28002 RepID=A0AA86UEV2_9EUKA|nr:Hypothetical protein HINF_LOCUS43050 [Hexamita inflata]
MINLLVQIFSSENPIKQYANYIQCISQLNNNQYCVLNDSEYIKQQCDGTVSFDKLKCNQKISENDQPLTLKQCLQIIKLAQNSYCKINGDINDDSFSIQICDGQVSEDKQSCDQTESKNLIQCIINIKPFQNQYCQKKGKQYQIETCDGVVSQDKQNCDTTNSKNLQDCIQSLKQNQYCMKTGNKYQTKQCYGTVSSDQQNCDSNMYNAQIDCVKMLDVNLNQFCESKSNQYQLKLCVGVVSDDKLTCNSQQYQSKEECLAKINKEKNQFCQQIFNSFQVMKCDGMVSDDFLSCSSNIIKDKCQKVCDVLGRKCEKRGDGFQCSKCLKNQFFNQTSARCQNLDDFKKCRQTCQFTCSPDGKCEKPDGKPAPLDIQGMDLLTCKNLLGAASYCQEVRPNVFMQQPCDTQVSADLLTCFKPDTLDLDKCQDGCNSQNAQYNFSKTCNCLPCPPNTAINVEYNMCQAVNVFLQCRRTCKGTCSSDGTCSQCEADDVYVYNMCVDATSQLGCLKQIEGKDKTYCQNIDGQFYPTACLQNVTTDRLKCVDNLTFCRLYCYGTQITCDEPTLTCVRVLLTAPKDKETLHQEKVVKILMGVVIGSFVLAVFITRVVLYNQKKKKVKPLYLPPSRFFPM